MAREFGPWVRTGWCPFCDTTTEQSRWQTAPGPGSTAGGVRVRCNECGQKVPAALGQGVLDALAPAVVPPVDAAG